MQREKYNKVITILTIITSIATIISVAFNNLIPLMQFLGSQDNGSEMNSVGIIGSADGPTSVFVSNGAPSNLIPSILALLSIIGILYLVFIRRLRK